MLKLHLDAEIKEYSVNSSSYNINPNCNYIQFYCNQASIPIKLCYESYPISALTKDVLPTLIWHEEIVKSDDIISYLKQYYVNIDNIYKENEKSDIKAYHALVDTEIKNISDYLTWCDDDMYSTITKKHYASDIPFPTNLINFYSRARAERKVLKNFSINYNKNQIKEKIYNIFTYFSAKLGSQAFLFGNLSSSVDFKLASYIKFIYKSSKIIQLKIDHNNNDNLSSYIIKILESKFINLLRHAEIITYLFSKVEISTINKNNLNNDLNDNFNNEILSLILKDLFKNDEYLWNLYKQARLYNKYQMKKLRNIPKQMTRKERIKYKEEKYKEILANNKLDNNHIKLSRNYYFGLSIIGLIFAGLSIHTHLKKKNQNKNFYF